MPPIPPTFDEETLASLDSLHRREKDLRDFQLPRLQACKGPIALQQQYVADLREDLDAFARQVEALDVAVEDQKGDRNRRELRRIVEVYQDTLISLRKAARSAILSSKQSLDSQQLSNRDELLRAATPNGKVAATSEKSSYVLRAPYGITFDASAREDVLMKANSDVTDALRRTINLMQNELERSVLSSQMLEQSSATLRSTSSTYDTLNMFLGTSKELVTILEKSDWLDRLLIISALVFFFVVTLFIVKQRVIDRGLRVALWWTRFIPSAGNSDLVFDKAEKGEGIVSAIVTTTSSLASPLSTMSGEGSSTITTGSSVVASVTEVLSRTSSALSVEPTVHVEL
ncbi:hypothetical protein JAAARDRAFT_57628 [Jaapia argillacea MUCL 33604]|uniref:Sec20 C-terminal domain-containing protein n=1 Tax=Jaapia argillacea MUCL 33604 TaxID=933084 RepID=A0A067PV88_9AGAM|nr:hypothetical protein JAAARDRAFT_57628 [Jaapia argillacea MUCL 33604]